MSQRYPQGTNNFDDSQTNPAPSWQEEPTTIPGDFGAAPAQQRSDGAGCTGDRWDENIARSHGISNQYPGNTGPTDVYASHAGQLGTTGQRNRLDPTVGNMGGQDRQTYARGPEPVLPPPAVPQPEANTVQPSTSDKLVGNVEKLAGKISGNERLVERGQARKNGSLHMIPGAE